MVASKILHRLTGSDDHVTISQMVGPLPLPVVEALGGAVEGAGAEAHD